MDGFDKRVSFISVKISLRLDEKQLFTVVQRKVETGSLAMAKMSLTGFATNLVTRIETVPPTMARAKVRLVKHPFRRMARGFDDRWPASWNG